jgi:squalene-hopene/tetraprenyl-beta-curcumene cyclase
VVSYALPALIAIGQAIHHHHPSWNPLPRLIRQIMRRPTLTVLELIQPENGGFLEATPLTSFVTMALASPVRRRVAW